MLFAFAICSKQTNNKYVYTKSNSTGEIIDSPLTFTDSTEPKEKKIVLDPLCNEFIQEDVIKINDLSFSLLGSYCSFIEYLIHFISFALICSGRTGKIDEISPERELNRWRCCLLDQKWQKPTFLEPLNYHFWFIGKHSFEFFKRDGKTTSRTMPQSLAFWLR